MCAIYLIYDPKSQIVNSGMDVEDLKRDVAKNLLKDENFDWSDVSDISTAYKSVCKTKLEKELDALYIIIAERRQAAEDLDWVADFDQKDKILSTHDGYIKKYNELVSDLKQERQDKLMHGDYTISELESWHKDKK